MTMNQQEIEQACREFCDCFDRLRTEIAKSIVGHDRLVENVLTAMFCGGHVLLEGVPGLGKTLLVRTLAKVLSLKFSRIQFTPDLMPADIIGTTMVMEDPGGKRHFEFQPGPLFAQIVLTDEINRATPKTQSALLEAMQEHSVTVGGTSYKLEEPFWVLATQNPIEQEGTYPPARGATGPFLLQSPGGLFTTTAVSTDHRADHHRLPGNPGNHHGRQGNSPKPIAGQAGSNCRPRFGLCR